MDNWTARRTKNDQGADFREVKMHGKISRLEFTIIPKSRFWRAGFKLVDPNASILPLRDNNSLLFHLGSCTNKKYGFTAYHNGTWIEELNKTKTYPEDRLLTIRLDVDHGNRFKVYVNGSLEFKPIWKISNPNTREKVVLIAWGDNKNYKVDFSNITFGNWKDVEVKKSIITESIKEKSTLPWHIKMGLLLSAAALIVAIISIPWWQYFFKKNDGRDQKSSLQNEPSSIITLQPISSYGPIEVNSNNSSINIDEGKSYTDKISGVTLGVNFVLSKFYSSLTITFPGKPSEEFEDVKSGRIFDYVGSNGLNYKLTIVGIESNSIEMMIRKN